MMVNLILLIGAKRMMNHETMVVLADYRQFVEDNLIEFIDVVNKSVLGNFDEISNSWRLIRFASRDNLDTTRRDRFTGTIGNLKGFYNVNETEYGMHGVYGYASNEKFLL